MMKHARRQTHTIVVLVAVLCVPLGVHGQSDRNQGMPIQEAGQSGVLIGEDKNQDAKFFSFMNNGMFQWRLPLHSNIHHSIVGVMFRYGLWRLILLMGHRLVGRMALVT